MLSSRAEAETQRFYLRKLEGAEVFLVTETNFFRQELHKWCHVTSEPPPLFQESKSTRKPRPTKLQKLMAQYGVEDPDDLPEEVKGKANSLRRKSKYYQGRAEGVGSGMSPPAPAGQTPVLGTPIRGEGGRERDPWGRPVGEGEQVGGGMMHPGVLMPGGPRVVMDEQGDSLEERLLRGQLDGLNLHSEPVRGKALELLRRTDVGRRRAEEIYGPNVWGGGFASGAPGSAAGPQPEAGYPREVEKMFVDLTNRDEEEKKPGPEALGEVGERNGVGAPVGGE